MDVERQAMERRISEMDALERLHLTVYASARRDPAPSSASTVQGGKRGRKRAVVAVTAAVEQCDVATGEVYRRYSSASTAAAAMQVSAESVVECCRGATSAASGFGWRFITDPTATAMDESGYKSVQMLLLMKYKSESACASPRADTFFPPLPERYKPVEQVSVHTGEVLRRYASQKEAANSMQIAYKTVSRCCQRAAADPPLGVSHGFLWRNYEGPPIDFESDNIANNRPGLVALLQMKTSPRTRRKASAREDEGEGSGLADGLGALLDAAEEAGTHLESTPEPSKRQRRASSLASDRSSDAGVGSLAEQSDQKKGAPSPHTVRNAVAVELFDPASGDVLRRFGSQREAAVAMGTSHKLIAKCCKGVRQSSDGIGYRYYTGPSISFTEDSSLSVLEEDALQIKSTLTSGESETESADAGADSKAATQRKMTVLKPRMQSSKRDTGTTSGIETAPPRTHHSATKVEQFNVITGEAIRQFSSQSDAAAHVRGSQQLISNACRGKLSEAFGFGWRFVWKKS